MDSTENRMQPPPRKRGRPSLVDAARMKAEQVPPPEPVRDPVPMFRCMRCRGLFAPRVYRTMPNQVRVMRCDRCGTQHPIAPELLAKLL